MTEQAAPQPRLLAELDLLLNAAGAACSPEQSGALWRLAEDERQLDANLIRLPAGHRIEVHREPDVDVLVVVLTGGGTVRTDEGTLALAPHALLWLPHGSQCATEAVTRGRADHTAQRKRTAMQIKRVRDPEPVRRREARQEESEG